MNSPRLTEEQKKIVEENHNLIFWYIREKGLDINECYDILAIELCHTVMKYDPTKGALSNYFKLRADGALYKELVRANAKKRPPRGGEFIDNIHSIANANNQLNEIEVNDWIESMVGTREYDIIRMKLAGNNQYQIAEELGISQSYVSLILKELKKQYYEDNR